MFMNDMNLIDNIKIWLQPYDRYKLYKFLSDDYYQSLLFFLKELCSQKCSKTDQKICFNSETFLDPLHALSTAMSELVLQSSKNPN